MPLKSLLQAFAPKLKARATQRVRVAVVGAGRMGRHHIRHLSQIPTLIWWRSPMPNLRAPKKSPASIALKPYGMYRLDRSVEAVVIATPTQTHAALGKLFLENGVSCLIEKTDRGDRGRGG